MLPSPFLPPCTAIVFRVRKIDVGGKTFDGVFEGREEWGFGIAVERSVKVGVMGKGTHSETGSGSSTRLSVHATAPGS